MELWELKHIIAKNSKLIACKFQAKILNNARAQYELGNYYKGKGVIPKDPTKALKWYQKSAEQGYVDALCALSHFYEEGVLLKKDYAKALEFYLKGTNQGKDADPYRLGLLYEANKNYEESVKWIIKAADQGNAGAKFNLGGYYALGIGVPQDFEKALNCFAVNNSLFFQSKCYKYGWIVKRDPKKAKDLWEQDYVMVSSHKPVYIPPYRGYESDMGIEGFKALCSTPMANMYDALDYGLEYYEKGDKYPKNYEKAVEEFTKAAELGNAEAKYYLGICYKDGKGVPQDQEEATKWFTKAAEQGYEPMKDEPAED